MPRPALHLTEKTEHFTSRIRSHAIAVPASEMTCGVEKTKKRIRGPWDDSGCIRLDLNVDCRLRPLERAVVSS
jgi:hypothetical protein